MTDFNDRKKAYEDKFARDEELMFKVRARAAKSLGAWVAQKLVIAADDYAASLVNHVTHGKSDEQVVALILADAANKGQTLSAHQVSEKFAQCLAEAKAQMMSN